MDLSYYEMAQQLFGTVPVGFEFIYLLLAFILFLATVFIIVFPAIFIFKVLLK